MRQLVKEKRKFGFTLIELMIAMAIMVVMMTIVWGTFLIVNASHANVVVVNDAKDYAELNMQAITNMLANADKIALSNVRTIDATESAAGLTKSAYFDTTTGDLMYYDSGTLKTGLHLSQYTVTDSVTGLDKNKWYIVPSYTYTTSTLTVTLSVYDNATGNLYYTLKSALFMPNVKDTPTGSGIVLKLRTKAFPV